MSHPGATSCRCSLRISRRRRRIRLRLTAFPSAFLTLHPNRLSSKPLGRRKTVNWLVDRRRPSRYTASYSARCTRRQPRGNPSRGWSSARKAMAPFLAALRKDLPSTGTLHACAKTVFLMAAAHMRLIRPFRQRCFSSAMSVKNPGAFLSSEGLAGQRRARTAASIQFSGLGNESRWQIKRLV
jgi:hypothetical protein